MLHKNWTAICAEANPTLRILAATVEDQRVLEGLEKGFPQLFTTEQQREPKVPLSAIKSIIKHAGSDGADDSAYEVCDRLKIPLLYFGPSTADHSDSRFEPVPAEFKDKCSGCLECESPFEAEWRGQKMVIVYDHEDGDFLVLAPSSCFDFET